MITRDEPVHTIWERHYTSFPGRIPDHWTGPRETRTLLEALGLEPACRCEALGAEMIEADALGGALVIHLVDCAWLDWTRRTGGCMVDSDDTA